MHFLLYKQTHSSIAEEHQASYPHIYEILTEH